MHHRDGGGRQELERPVARRHGVQAVARRLVEAERPCRVVAVERQGRSGQRTRAEGRAREPRAGVAETSGVAPEHLHVGVPVVCESQRLGALEMRVARQDRVQVLLGAREQHAPQLREPAPDGAHGIAQEERQVRRDLVVAAATRVQASPPPDPPARAAAPPRSCGCPRPPRRRGIPPTRSPAPRVAGRRPAPRRRRRTRFLIGPACGRGRSIPARRSGPAPDRSGPTRRSAPRRDRSPRGSGRPTPWSFRNPAPWGKSRKERAPSQARGRPAGGCVAAPRVSRLGPGG